MKNYIRQNSKQEQTNNNSGCLAYPSQRARYNPFQAKCVSTPLETDQDSRLSSCKGAACQNNISFLKTQTRRRKCCFKILCESCTMRTSITQRADPIGVTIKQAFGHKVLWMVGIGRKRRQIEKSRWQSCSRVGLLGKLSTGGQADIGGRGGLGPAWNIMALLYLVQRKKIH